MILLSLSRVLTHYNYFTEFYGTRKLRNNSTLVRRFPVAPRMGYVWVTIRLSTVKKETCRANRNMKNIKKWKFVLTLKYVKKMCMVVQAFEKLYNQTRLRVIWFTLYLAGRPIDSEWPEASNVIRPLPTWRQRWRNNRNCSRAVCQQVDVVSSWVDCLFVITVSPTEWPHKLISQTSCIIVITNRLIIINIIINK